MSVVIKDMKMPTSCYYCGLADTSFINCQAFSQYKLLENDCEDKRPEWCPLVELPEHHGDLIDRDALSLRGRLKFIEERETQLYGGVSWSFAGCMTAINDAPVIIEAEGEEE